MKCLKITNPKTAPLCAVRCAVKGIHLEYQLSSWERRGSRRRSQCLPPWNPKSQTRLTANRGAIPPSPTGSHRPSHPSCGPHPPRLPSRRTRRAGDSAHWPRLRWENIIPVCTRSRILFKSFKYSPKFRSNFSRNWNSGK